MNNTVQISKIDAAIRQLETAAHLYFSDGDICSIHTLAAASLEITSTLAKGTYTEQFLLQDKIYSKIPEKKRNEAHKRIQYQRNFLKHADRDKEKILDFSPEITDIILLSAVIPLRILATDNNINFYRLDNNKLRLSAIEVLHYWFIFKSFFKEINISELKKFLIKAKLNIELPETFSKKNFHLLFHSILDEVVDKYGKTIIEILEEIIKSEEITNILDKLNISEKQ